MGPRSCCVCLSLGRRRIVSAQDLDDVLHADERGLVVVVAIMRCGPHVLHERVRMLQTTTRMLLCPDRFSGVVCAPKVACRLRLRPPGRKRVATSLGMCHGCAVWPAHANLLALFPAAQCASGATATTACSPAILIGRSVAVFAGRLRPMHVQLQQWRRRRRWCAEEGCRESCSGLSCDCGHGHVARARRLTARHRGNGLGARLPERRPLKRPGGHTAAEGRVQGMRRTLRAQLHRPSCCGDLRLCNTKRFREHRCHAHILVRRIAPAGGL
mmetsp:Transcript_100342/g.289732  ORF Transcript_100342/g.289732 Transcript_100342/m.289732 type:complete len:271 (+) Transcript_100342:1395-2207(+)